MLQSWTKGRFLKYLMFHLTWAAKRFSICFASCSSLPCLFASVVRLVHPMSKPPLHSKSVTVRTLLGPVGPWCHPCFKAPCAVFGPSVLMWRTLLSWLISELYLWTLCSIERVSRTENKAKVRKRKVWTTLPWACQFEQSLTPYWVKQVKKWPVLRLPTPTPHTAPTSCFIGFNQ